MTVSASGLFRDEWGIPHVRGASLTEVARLQGLATARDRAWQLEIERLRGEGRTAELLGPAGLEWDRFARRVRLAAVAQTAFRRLDAETQGFLAAYVDGVRAGLAETSCIELDELGPAPGTWQPWTPFAVFWVQQILFGSFPSKLFGERAARVLGEEAALFRTEGLAGGSNAYAVGGGRTASGLPLVAGDPHRLFEAPNVYLQVRLACTDPADEFDVVGMTFPGVPGVQHFAHAGRVAWGITNAMADYQDLVSIDLERSADGSVSSSSGAVRRSVETVRVRGQEPVEVEVLETDRGPVVLGGPEVGSALVLRTPGHELDDLGFGTLLPLLRARSVADVEAAVSRWVEPVNNWVVADVNGDVVHTVGGRVPQRDETGEWVGWVSPLPRRTSPASGALVTANDRCMPEFDALADGFAPPFRAQRIRALLDDAGPLDVEQAVAVLADTTQTAGERLLELVPADLLPGELSEWDGTMDASSGAAWYAALRAEVVDRICAAPVLAPLREPSEHGPLYEPWSALPARVASALHVILAAERPFGLDPHEVVTAAAVAVRDAARDTAHDTAHDTVRDTVPDAGTEPASWPEAHRFWPLHALEQFDLPHTRTAPATPLPGDTDTVRCNAWSPGTTVTVRGSVARYAWDLADRDNSRWVVPLGASGAPDDPHHTDQHEAWARGGAVRVVTDWSVLTEEQQ
ncbi:penicillin amidase [Nocardioides luteus]|uniref:Antibiotic transporter n=1 Tax=Nocardioides luteus TaxID=1844 RepID=A0ABQ5SSJ8_9ACTN|nr:penicillin acylase family protein [Nocardioides luteus]MDR7311389.1 penicillin amidase [Nocardioides luteus]GGR65568.1 antibiotic transporter [Nocardioides luteus]GLJ66894.1 antibiotic transporter [Nocardioides luteus]